MATKELNVRLQLKYDLYSEWTKNNPKLNRGEAALAYIPTDSSMSVGNQTFAGTTPPNILMKIGDGEHNYNDLKFVSALAADVNEYAKLTKADFEAQVKGLASAQMSEAVQTNAGAIAALQALVGSDKVEDQIVNAITALELAKTYAAKVHTHTKEEITDFAHTHTVSEITDFDTEVKKYDYATKTEAQGYASTVQGKLDELDAYVGDIPTGYTEETIVAYIDKKAAETLSAAQGGSSETAASVLQALNDYKGLNDPKVQGNTDAIDAMKKDATIVTFKGIEEKMSSDKSELQGKIDGEIARATDAEEALAGRVKAIEDDYLTSSDKEALQAQINTIMNNPDTEGAINSINEFTQYIADHGTIAEGFRTDIDENKGDIADHEARIKSIEDKSIASGAQVNVIETVKVNGVALEVDGDKAVNVTVPTGTLASKNEVSKDELASGLKNEIEGKAEASALGQTNKTVSSNTGRIAALEASKDAYVGADATLKSELQGKIDAIDNHSHANKALLDTYTQTEANLADAVAKKHEHTNKTVLDGITAEKVSAWDAKADKSAYDETVATVADHETRIKAIEEVDTLILNCGTSKF